MEGTYRIITEQSTRPSRVPRRPLTLSHGLQDHRCRSTSGQRRDAGASPGPPLPSDGSRRELRAARRPPAGEVTGEHRHSLDLIKRRRVKGRKTTDQLHAINTEAEPEENASAEPEESNRTLRQHRGLVQERPRTARKQKNLSPPNIV